jgi:cell division initiation protein
MERLKPVELQRLNIPKRPFGYEVAYVDHLMERIIKELEFLIEENNRLQEISDQALKEAERFRLQENTLKEALLLAQKAASEVRANAHKEAEVILMEAHQKATEIEKKAQDKFYETKWNIEVLKQQKRQFEQKWRNILEEQLKLLERDKESSKETEPVESRPLHVQSFAGEAAQNLEPTPLSSPLNALGEGLLEDLKNGATSHQIEESLAG